MLSTEYSFEIYCFKLTSLQKRIKPFFFLLSINIDKYINNSDINIYVILLFM